MDPPNIFLLQVNAKVEKPSPHYFYVNVYRPKLHTCYAPRPE